MKRPGLIIIISAIILIIITFVARHQFSLRPVQSQASRTRPDTIIVDYPVEGSIFPPEFPAPTWQWRTADGNTDNPSKNRRPGHPAHKKRNDTAAVWKIAVTFSDGTPPISVESAGEPLRLGAIDPRCVTSSNSAPALTPQQAAAHTWKPDSSTWAAMKAHSAGAPATIVITGYRRGDAQTVVARGTVSIRTSSDSVGAPVFYRDVPLMPSNNEKGVIKPLDTKAFPLIAWRLRSIADTKSRVLMQGLHTCANCHSFSADGKTLGMDMDGPRNEKGLYAIVKIGQKTVIRKEDLVEWSTFRGKLGSKLRVGFMSQISPDGRRVITTVNDPLIDQTDFERRRDPVDLVRNYYVANFRDYRFLQVFYPTRGVLAWYSSKTAHLRYLPGADDTRFVHANAVWSPDGKYLVFVRAPARDAYSSKKQPARFANDSNETQIRYDLYRIPFNEGRGGTPEPIAGASNNGMSNSFPKISPDGRWIVFVKSRNGLLMRPDGQLYIVPAGGGPARRMKCNTPLMNSWHSFSPNGRWMVFSSKSRTPYTQMFLTHIDSSGDDSPPILIENATAANRAVNIPEFVNIPPDGMMKIEAPAVEYALHVNLALEAMKKARYDTAALEWKKVLSFSSEDPWVHNSLGVALMESGKTDEAISHYRKALELNPRYAEARNNIGEALAGRGDDREAIVQLDKAVQLDSGLTTAHATLGMVLARTRQTDKAIFHLRIAAAKNPEAEDVLRNLGHVLAEKGVLQEARVHLEEAVRLSQRRDPLALFLLGRVYTDMNKKELAVEAEREAFAIAMQQNNTGLMQAIGAHLYNVLGTEPPQ
jgi:Flp pilus assembly protein TadD